MRPWQARKEKSMTFSSYMLLCFVGAGEAAAVTEGAPEAVTVATGPKTGKAERKVAAIETEAGNEAAGVAGQRMKTWVFNISSFDLSNIFHNLLTHY